MAADHRHHILLAKPLLEYLLVNIGVEASTVMQLPTL
jgi:hypothetical protein